MLKRLMLVAFVALWLKGQCSLVDDLILRKIDFTGARTMRASSADPNWQNGNWDARPIPPGETLTIAQLEGPGLITHIWFTIAAEDRYFPRMLTLRIYWDGEKTPSVESPIGDFFAVGHGLRAWVNSAKVEVSSDGLAYNCYWLMPFRKSARITVSNDSKYPVGALYYMVDWVKLKSLPEDIPYFHAQYRQEFPCEKGKDYLILDTVGSGFYAGTVLSVEMGQPGWFGEGDDRFYVDGEAEPSLKGTGTEDYFNDAWGFRQFTHPHHGVTIWEGYDTGDRGTAYRWHLEDPVFFNKSLRVTIEHKGAIYDWEKRTFVSGFGERDDYFSSVAFWYQRGRAKRFASVPPAEERLPKGGIYIEGESLIPTGRFEHGDRVQVQEGGAWSGGKQMFYTPPDKSSVEVRFDVKEDGLYLLKGELTHSWDYGIWKVYLDGEELGEFNLYSPQVSVKKLNWGTRQLKAGTHVLRFVCVGKDEKSTGYYFGLDGIYLRKVR